MISDPQHRRWPQVPGEDLARAVAITMVVALHANWGEMNGGVNVLILASGYAFARLNFATTTRATVSAMAKFCVRLGWPALALVAFFAVNDGVYRWQEFAMISNWISTRNNARIPLWFPQAMIQMLLVLMAIFAAFDLTPRIRARPVMVATAGVILALAALVADDLLWTRPEAVGDALPQRILFWNFLLGWLLWAIIGRGDRSSHNKIAATVALITTATVASIVSEINNSLERVAVLIALGSLIIWVDRIGLPPGMARVVRLIAQSSYVIFLLHLLAFYYVDTVLVRAGLEALVGPGTLTVLAITVCVLVWAVGTAALRAYRRRMHANFA